MHRLFSMHRDLSIDVAGLRHDRHHPPPPPRGPRRLLLPADGRRAGRGRRRAAGPPVPGAGRPAPGPPAVPDRRRRRRRGLHLRPDRPDRLVPADHLPPHEAAPPGRPGPPRPARKMGLLPRRPRGDGSTERHATRHGTLAPAVYAWSPRAGVRARHVQEWTVTLLDRYPTTTVTCVPPGLNTRCTCGFPGPWMVTLTVVVAPAASVPDIGETTTFFVRPDGSET